MSSFNNYYYLLIFLIDLNFIESSSSIIFLVKFQTSRKKTLIRVRASSYSIELKLELAHYRLDSITPLPSICENEPINTPPIIIISSNNNNNNNNNKL